MVLTGRAKSAIRRSLRNERRVENIRLGNAIARNAFEKVNKKPTERALVTAAKKIGSKTADDILAALGAAELTGIELIKLIYPEMFKGENLPEYSLDVISFVGLPAGAKGARRRSAGSRRARGGINGRKRVARGRKGVPRVLRRPARGTPRLPGLRPRRPPRAPPRLVCKPHRVPRGLRAPVSAPPGQRVALHARAGGQRRAAGLQRYVLSSGLARSDR